MCCLAPFPGSSVPPQLSLSPLAPAPLLPVTKPNTAAQGRTANSPPAPLVLGHDHQGSNRLRDVAPVPPTRRREQAGRQGGEEVQAAPGSSRLPAFRKLTPGNVARRNFAKPQCELREWTPAAPGEQRPRGFGEPRTCLGTPRGSTP